MFPLSAPVTDEETLLYNSPHENHVTTSPTRVFPDLDQILANNTNADTAETRQRQETRLPGPAGDRSALTAATTREGGPEAALVAPSGVAAQVLAVAGLAATSVAGFRSSPPSTRTRKPIPVSSRAIPITIPNTPTRSAK